MYGKLRFYSRKTIANKGEGIFIKTTCSVYVCVCGDLLRGTYRYDFCCCCWDDGFCCWWVVPASARHDDCCCCWNTGSWPASPTEMAALVAPRDSCAFCGGPTGSGLSDVGFRGGVELVGRFRRLPSLAQSPLSRQGRSDSRERGALL